MGCSHCVSDFQEILDSGMFGKPSDYFEKGEKMEIEITCKINGEEYDAVVKPEVKMSDSVGFNVFITPKAKQQTITLADYIATASDRGQTEAEAEADFKESVIQNLERLEIDHARYGWMIWDNECPPIYNATDDGYRLPYTNGKLPEWKVLDMPGYEGDVVPCPLIYNEYVYYQHAKGLDAREGSITGKVKSTKPEAAHAWNNEVRKEKGE